MAIPEGERKDVVVTDAAANDVRVDFAEYVNRVAFGAERIRVMRHGKPAAALVSIEDLAKLDGAA